MCDAVSCTCQTRNEVNKRTGLTGTGTGQTSVGTGHAGAGIDIVTKTGVGGIGTEMSDFETGISVTETHSEARLLSRVIPPTQPAYSPQPIAVGKENNKEGCYDDEMSDNCLVKVDSPIPPRRRDQIVQTDPYSHNQPASKDDTTLSLCLGGDLEGQQGISVNHNWFAPPLIGMENGQGTSMDISTVPPVMASAKGQGTAMDIGTIPLPNKPETVINQINAPHLSGSGELLAAAGCVPPPSGPVERPRTPPSSNKAAEDPAANTVDQSLVSEPVLVSPTHMSEHATSPQAIITDCAEEKLGSGEAEVSQYDGGVDQSSCWTVTPCGSPDAKHPHSIGPLLNEVRLAKIIISPHFIFEC